MSRERSYCEKYQRIIDHSKAELSTQGSYANDDAWLSGQDEKGNSISGSLPRIEKCDPDFKFNDKQKKLIDKVYDMLLDKYKFKKSKRHSKSKSKTIKKPKNKTNKRSKSKSKTNKKSKTKI